MPIKSRFNIVATSFTKVHHITCAVETVDIMSKKLNLDETAKTVEDLSKKVDVITRNRLVIAIFLIGPAPGC